MSPVADRPELADLTQVSLDMRDESSVRSAFDAIGPLDHLVVTAAPDLGSWGSFMDADMQGVRSSLALELAPTRVNTIRPGFIDFLPAEQREGLRRQVAASFPTRRAG